MSIELVRDMINFEKLIGEGIGQMMVNGDIILGERNPEIINILNMDGKVVVNSAETVEDRVIIDGKMNFEVLYSSNDNQGIYKMSAASNFNHNIQIPGTMAHMPCKIDTVIEHMDYDQINNRKIKVNAIININAMVYDRNSIEAVTDIKTPDVQVLKNKLMMDEYVAENSGQSIIKSRFETGANIVNSILKNNLFIHKKDVSIDAGRAIINACVRIRLIYDNIDGDILALEQDVPFTNEMAIPDLRSDMKCDVAFKIADVYDEIKEDDNGERKIIETEIVIDINAKGYAKKEIENVVDAYSTNQRYEMDKETVKSLSYFGEGSESEGIKERISLPDNAKPIGKVKNLLAKPILTDVKIVEDKVVVEGIINCCLIYEAGVEEGGISSHLEEIPFKSAIDIPGTKIDMISDTGAHVCDVSFEGVSERNVDVKMLLISMAKVYNKMTSDVAKGATEAELPESAKNMPSIVVYTIQQNDTLWKIAKKYSTTIEDVIALNEIENPDMLQLGMKLLIPKKMFMK